MAGSPVPEPPKTNSAAPVDESVIGQSPFAFNGRVFTTDPDGEYQASGVVAGNPKLFFTSASIFFNERSGWRAPASWEGGGVTTGALPPEFVVSDSRGYFRWSSYAATARGSAGTIDFDSKFSTDIALAWGLEPFYSGEPAVIDYNGYKNLKKHADLSMITGFPMTLDYTEEPGLGMLHATTPELTTFQGATKNYLHATHISTGPGNDGGPIWLQDGEGAWDVSGIVVSGRPSEAGIHGFTPSIKSLLKAAAPLVGEPRKSIKNGSKGIGTSTGRYVLAKPKKLPDGLHSWTKIPFKVQRFEENNVLTGVYLDLTVTTQHIGDLMVGLLSPDGTFVMVHDGQGAGEDDLVIDDRNLTGPFTDAAEEAENTLLANGTWTLLLQDRLTGDQCVVTRAELELRVSDGGEEGEEGN